MASRELKYAWLYQDDYVDALFKYLKNPQVAKGYAKDAEKSFGSTGSTSRWSSRSSGITNLDCLWISYGITAKISGPDKLFEEWPPPSLADTDKFIGWAKKHTEKDIDSFTWNFRVGAIYSCFDHVKEAFVELEKAEQHS
ncbi:hypothetical protein E8E12_006119 [Didymella heteroderae]|uniref:Uncharacterized protein n=1 Tax=Didymella heteroderae TaxID=1769908 RepID=A0A9P4WK95_9PLEO|nr:hypothetical protein E8E12_006119 [Didymella heteroderae]